MIFNKFFKHIQTKNIVNSISLNKNLYTVNYYSTSTNCNVNIIEKEKNSAKHSLSCKTCDSVNTIGLSNNNKDNKDNSSSSSNINIQNTLISTTNNINLQAPLSTISVENKPKSVVSFYKRNLPAHLVEFSSDEGRKLFKESLSQGYMEGYFALAEQFVSQSDPAYCGLASLAMVLNSLKIDPKRLWKGPWRWFAEDMLDCCIPIESVKKRGITFTEFSCLSRCNGANIKSVRADESDINVFREGIKEACSKVGTHLVMSYSRKALGQTGSGHYSPIGGYHEEKDLALVLDVARFKYSPHWVPVSVLWESMIALDKDTGRPRGYYIMSSDPLYTPSFCRIKNTLSWSSVADKFMSIVTSKLQKSNPQTQEELIELIFNNLPQETSYVLCAYSHELYRKLSLIEKNNEILGGHSNNNISNPLDWNHFFHEITHSPSFGIIKKMLEQNRITNWRVSHQDDLNTPKEICHDYPIQLATLLFLSIPSHLFNNLPFFIRENIAIIRNLDNLNIQVINEIMKIRDEMFKVSQSPCECSSSEQQGCKIKQ